MFKSGGLHTGFSSGCIQDKGGIQELYHSLKQIWICTLETLRLQATAEELLTYPFDCSIYNQFFLNPGEAIQGHIM